MFDWLDVLVGLFFVAAIFVGVSFGPQIIGVAIWLHNRGVSGWVMGVVVGAILTYITMGHNQWWQKRGLRKLRKYVNSTAMSAKLKSEGYGRASYIARRSSSNTPSIIAISLLMMLAMSGVLWAPGGGMNSIGWSVFYSWFGLILVVYLYRVFKKK